MGHWVTLDDDQHVYISDGGKVLATRGAISSAAGGKERGRALAGRSKAAVDRAVAKARAGKSNTKPGLKATGRGTEDRKLRAKQILEAREKGHFGTARSLSTKEKPLGYEKIEAERLKNRIARQTHNVELVKEHLSKGGQALVPSQTRPLILRHPELVKGINKKGEILIQERKNAVAALPRGGQAEKVFVRDARQAKAVELRAGRQQSPATARAIEHARAAVTGKTPDWIKGKTQGADENWKSLRQRTQQNQQYNQMTMKRRGMTTAQLVAKLKAAR